MYAARSRGVSSRKVTRVPSCSTSSQPGVSRQRPDMTTWVFPESSSSICSASVASAGLPKISPCSTTSVSTPSTGRPSESSATLRAFPCAYSRTICVASASSGGGTSSYRGSATSNGMPSCSRMARRCGERDASRSGAAGGASATLGGDPELLGRPLPSPLGRHVVVIGVRLGPFRREQLEQAVDHEVIRAQELDPIRVPDVELHFMCVGPLDLVHSLLRALQLGG